MDGILITFEGVEGSGKSTLLATMAGALRAEGHVVTTSREPGGTPAGERIRDVVLDVGHAAMEPWTELFLMLAARAQVVGEIIRPALERGEIVLCDRYMDASTAYQGVARGLGLERVEELNRLATGNLPPHLTFLVDLSPEEGRERMRRAHDRMEKEDLSFHHSVRDAYLELARRHPARFHVLDGSLAPLSLAEAAWKRLRKLRPQLPIQLPPAP